jgi:hypothetical protein
MATKLDNLQTPGGRLVMGSLNTKSAKDHEGKAIAPEDQRYFFGLAVPKSTPGLMELINSIWKMAATDYANVPLVMGQINQGLAARDFSWKIQDGDVVTYDKKTGQPRPIPEYFKGCYIIKFSTNFEVSCCDFNGNDINRADIKTGDYADVIFNAVINGKMDDTAGIYLNPVAVRRLGFGEAITTGVSASQAFAGRAATMPVGASQMPTAAGATPPAGMGMPPAGMGMPGNGVPAQAPMGYAAAPTGMPAAMPSTASPSNTVPHTGILAGPQGGGMPGMPGMGG